MEQQRVAIGACRHHIASHGARGSGTIVDLDRHAEPSRQPLGQQPRDGVGHTARRNGTIILIGRRK
jgi:hypothetical protein